jgi:hypothetical protein
MLVRCVRCCVHALGLVETSVDFLLPLLTLLSAEMKQVHMKDLFAADPNRFAKFSQHWEDLLLLDYSKNIITEKTIQLLLDLARQAKVQEWAGKMFSGERINFTEDRAVLHIALRNRSNTPILVRPAAAAVLMTLSAGGRG